MSAPVEAISSAVRVVPGAFGASAPAAGVSPAEFAAVFRHYSETNVDGSAKHEAARIAHINMGLRVGTPYVNEQGGRTWWAF